MNFNIVEKIITYQYFHEVFILLIVVLYAASHLINNSLKKVKIEKKHLIAIFLFITGIKTQLIISDFIYNALLAEAKDILADGKVSHKEIIEYTGLVFCCRFIEYMMIFCTLNPDKTFGSFLNKFLQVIKERMKNTFKNQSKLDIAEMNQKIDLLLKKNENINN
jgi:hypothetical protein